MVEANELGKVDPGSIWKKLLGGSFRPSHDQVKNFHEKADTDGGPKAAHHSLGSSANQAAAGNHTHDGGNSAKLDQLLSDVTVTGSRGGNAALASLLSQLASKYGLIDSSTP